MHTRKFKRCFFIPLAFIFILSAAASPALAFDLILGTGEPGSFSHFSGRIIKRIIDKQGTGLTCKLMPGSGDTHNLTNLQQGSLDLALIDSRMIYDAVAKKGNFKFLDMTYESLSLVMPVYNTPVTLIVRREAGISSLENLRGKRINAGAPLSLQRLWVQTILTAKNWSRKDFMLVTEISASQSQDTMAFCHGGIDAMVHMGVHPDPGLKQLFRLCNGDLARVNDPDMARTVGTHPAFSFFTIPAGTYESHPADITTLGSQTFLLASQDLDKETVYALIDTLFKHRDRLKNAHPALSIQNPDIKRIKRIGIDFHSGAVQFFHIQ